MASKDDDNRLENLLKEHFENRIRSMPRQHPKKTKDCIPRTKIIRLSKLNESEIPEEDRQHIYSCEYCLKNLMHAKKLGNDSSNDVLGTTVIPFRQRYDKATPIVAFRKAASSEEEDESVLIIEENDHIERGKIKIDKDRGNLSGYFKMKPPYKRLTLLLPSQQIVAVEDQNDDLIEFKSIEIDDSIKLVDIRYELD